MGKAMRPIDNPEELKRLKYYFNCRSERDKMLFELMLMTGYRIGDMEGLYVGDVREALEKREFTIREEKIVNMKKSYCRKNGIAFNENDVIPREVPISKELAIKLKKYIENKTDDEYMFPSRNKGKHLTGDRFGKILSEAGKKLGFKHSIGNHTLRKTFAYNVNLITGGDIEKTRMMLSHSTVEATKLYLGTDKTLFKNTMEELSQLYK